MRETCTQYSALTFLPRLPDHGFVSLILDMNESKCEIPVWRDFVLLVHWHNQKPGIDYGLAWHHVFALVIDKKENGTFERLSLVIAAREDWRLPRLLARRRKSFLRKSAVRCFYIEGRAMTADRTL